MSRRSRIWLAVAVVFTLVNLGGGVVAIAAGEAAHTALHAVLLLVGVAWVWRLAASRSASRDASRNRSREEAVKPGRPTEFTNRLTNLEQSVDAVALEVERIGEGQRFVTRILTEVRPPHAATERVAEPIERQEERT